jgi:hypothetical protein
MTNLPKHLREKIESEAEDTYHPSLDAQYREVFYMREAFLAGAETLWKLMQEEVPAFECQEPDPTFALEEKIEEQAEQIALLREALGFYAEEKNWRYYQYPDDSHGPAYDQGKLARQALAKVRGEK